MLVCLIKSLFFNIIFRNIISISKEVEKQLLNLAETNSHILMQMESLDDEIQKKESSVDIWGKTSRFYYTVGEIKDHIMPDIVHMKS